MSFRAKLLMAMSLVAVVITGLGLFIAERKVAMETEHDLEVSFQAELNALHSAREIRQAALAERCRALVGRPRILAALEDDALDLLYLSARDELRDLMDEPEKESRLLTARFYRFLDRQGQVLPTDTKEKVGMLSANEEAQLALDGLPARQQAGFLWHGASESVVEVFAVPIVSSERGEVISALVIGLAPAVVRAENRGMASGLLVNDSLYFAGMQPQESKMVTDSVFERIQRGSESGKLRLRLGGKDHRVFFNRLNPGSTFAPAYEVCLYPLNALLQRQKALRWQAAGVCGILLCGGVFGSQVLARRLSKPVEKLEIDSAENLAQRQKAEAALELTSQELQRAARFSADASHQLKTPVTVLRAGLDELLVSEELSEGTREEISALLHQTSRLNNIIEDLLLLSRMDAGRLKLTFEAVNLKELIEGWMDDFSTLAHTAIHLETDFGTENEIRGERRYTTMIVENLLENARKYNEPNGRIRISTRRDEEQIVLRIGNNGHPIAPEVQRSIFERFHRGTAAENVPGYGLGLNLARELARLHGGELRLVSSEKNWTEFEVRFCRAEKISRELMASAV